jgi:hypothetical protein
VDLSTVIAAVFCLVDDRLQGRSIRQRGPAPKLSDSEVLTIESVGEYLGLDTDKALYHFFRRHYAQWFPALFLRSIAPPSALKPAVTRRQSPEPPPRCASHPRTSSPQWRVSRRCSDPQLRPKGLESIHPSGVVGPYAQLCVVEQDRRALHPDASE